jgi:hypothetical protein
MHQHMDHFRMAVQYRLLDLPGHLVSIQNTQHWWCEQVEAMLPTLRSLKALGWKTKTVRNIEWRLAITDYVEYRTAGYVIGSGMMEATAQP